MSNVKVYELKENDTCKIDCQDHGKSLSGPLTVILIKKEDPKE